MNFELELAMVFKTVESVVVSPKTFVLSIIILIYRGTLPSVTFDTEVVVAFADECAQLALLSNRPLRSVILGGM